MKPHPEQVQLSFPDRARSHQPEPGSQISLSDLWQILLRRKLWIIAVFAVAIAGSIGASLLISPVYESRAAVLIGGIAGHGILERPVENPEVLVERLKYTYHVDEPYFKRNPPYLSSVAVARGAKQMVTLKAIGANPAEARDFLGRVVEHVMSDHRQPYDEAVRVQNEYLTAVEEQLLQLHQDVDALTEHLHGLKAKDPSEAALVTLERATRRAAEPTLESTRTTLRLVLMPPHTQPTQLLQEPTLPERAARPRPALYITVGVVLGILMGLFAAFCAELLASARKKNKELCMNLDNH
jgi:hypothetical protein